MTSTKLYAAVGIASLASMVTAANAATVGSIWLNDGDQIARVDLASPTSGAITMLPEFNGFGASFSDSLNRTSWIATDIAWSADRTTMYGVAGKRIGTGAGTAAHLFTVDPLTGTGNFIGTEKDVSGSQANLINALGLGTDGKMYTGFDDRDRLNSVDVATGVLTDVGQLSTPGKYSSGDVATYEGKTYFTVTDDINGGGNAKLLEVDLGTPIDSTVLGVVPELDINPLAGPQNVAAFALAAIDGVGLFGANGVDKTLWLIDPSNLSNTTQVSLTGTNTLAGFNGATALPASISGPAGPTPIPVPAGLSLILSGFAFLFFWGRQKTLGKSEKPRVLGSLG